MVVLSRCAPFWIAPDFRLALERSVWLIVTGNWQMHWASVAQLDRASDFGSEGCRFESCPTRQFSNGLQFVELPARPRVVSKVVTALFWPGAHQSPTMPHRMPGCLP